MGSMISISPIKRWSINKRLGKSKFDSKQEIWEIIIGSFSDYDFGDEVIYMHSDHYLQCKAGVWNMRVLNSRATPPMPQIELIDNKGVPGPLVYADTKCVVY